jgi:tetratricopeptide (TPR) repeat protein
MKMHRFTAWTASLLAAFVLASSAASAQDPDLSAARELYASAAYDDALAALNRLKSSSHAPGQSGTIDQYRAFCLLALGRTADAEQAIEAVVAAEPSYQPAEGDVSPRVRSAFADVRRRMLPAIIQQQYALAKSSFDRKDFAAAASGFGQVLVMMADPGVAAQTSQPPLSDMRMLAVGFEELSAKAAAPPPPPPPAPVVAPVPAVPAAPRVYGSEDRNVVPPVAVSQVLPAFPGPVGLTRSGKLEVLINEQGIVETAAMTATVTSVYDRLALAATKHWRYAPATVEGVPVKFRKVVQINIKPTVPNGRE